MELQVVCGLFYCFLLPAFLLAACLFRFNALSLVYLLYLLLLPWFLWPNERSLRGHTGRFTKALFVTSLLFLLAHVTFQICLYTVPGLDEELGSNCSSWETLTRTVGVSRLPLDEPWSVVRLLAPDVGVFIISLVTLVLGNRLLRQRENEPCQRNGLGSSVEEDEDEEDDEEDEEDEEEEGESSAGEPEGGPSPAARAALLVTRFRATARRVLRELGRVLAVVLLALAGITLPSAFSGVYFLLFLAVCTWWACHLPISHLGFNVVCVMVGFFTAGHLVCLYLYQSTYAQAFLPSGTLWPRLFGLKEIIIAGNCSSSSTSYDLILNMKHDWPVYVNPGILFLLYIAVAIVVKMGCPEEHKAEAEPQKRGSGGRGVQEEEVELESWRASRRDSEDDTKRSLLAAGETPASEPDRPGDHADITSSQQDGGSRGAPTGQDGDNPFQVVGRLVLEQSYVCALIAMMVWSITYHSWLTFVLLLWSCLIWMLRARRRFAMLCSPFILLYGVTLCGLQYIWALDLKTELPQTWGTLSLRQLGLSHDSHPCLRLGAMLLYTLTFWLLLRESVKDGFGRKKSSAAPLLEVTSGESSEQKRSILQALGRTVMSCYAKYWIYVCGGMFIMVSFAGKLVGYKIVYMLLFLLCLCLYQVYYSLWRRLLKPFWWLVVAYTMLVLTAIYTFQFEDFPDYWKNFTGFSEEQLADIGLETFELSELFVSILIPGFFLLACILQLHYFHHRFMKITDLEHVTPVPRGRSARKAEAAQAGNGAGLEEENLDDDLGDYQSEDGEAVPSKWGLVMDRLMVLFWKFTKILTQFQVFLWRVMEFHIVKILAFFVVWVALGEPSVMNLVLVVLWTFAMPYSRFRHMASCLSTVWVCIIIVCKMLYQLSVVNPTEYSRNCSVPLLNETNLEEGEILNSTLYREPVDPANWFGFRKDATALGYSQNHLLLLMLLVLEATVYRHQTHHYRQLQKSPPPTPALFPHTTRDTLDQGLLSSFKYLLNYFFYKFGLEICFLMMVNVIGQRMNFLAIVHSCWLVVMLTRRRRSVIAGIWPKYCLFLALFMVYQYLLCVGIPPVLCIDYPWRWSAPVTLSSALIKWMYLPDFYSIPRAKNLMADFLLLMCASQQWKVFENEKREVWMVLAGENRDDPNPMKGRPINPVPNFINCRCYLDMAKVLFFRYMFWLVLAVVFVTGATRISFFGLGYLLACFYFLLFGTQMLTRSARSRLLMWDCLIVYNVAVIISKNMLSILACVFVEQMQARFCWVIQLFSLACTVKGYYDPSAMDGQDCSLPVEEAGIIWDGICFFFLLLQRRVFLSFYFLHVTADLLASARQASRGFELFKASIVKSMKFHREVEARSLSQLKRSMERIQAKQKKLREGHLASESKDEEPPEADVSTKTSKQKKKWWRPWLDHATVLHSGEYYLFESDSEEEDEAEEQKPDKQSAFQLAYQAWVFNAKMALKDRQRRKEEQRLRSSQAAAAVAGEGEEEELKFEASPTQEEEESGEKGGSGRRDFVQRILDILRFLWVLFLAMVDGLTQWLNTLTKQYVDTSTVLCNERYFIIRSMDQRSPIENMECDRDSQVTEIPTIEICLDELAPESSSSATRCLEPDTTDPERTTAGTSGHSGAALCPGPYLKVEAGPEPQSRQRSQYFRTASALLADSPVDIEELAQSREFYASQNRALKLLFALYNLLAAHSELVCYFIIVLNNMVTASVISLVLPILVFLWAMLAVPRPTKRFWMTVIVYTEVMVVVKYLFQFGFFPWNSAYELKLNEDKPFFPPRILGLEKTERYIRYDLLQLLVLFFHRSLLQRYGLWDREDPLGQKTDGQGEGAAKGAGEGAAEGAGEGAAEGQESQPVPGPPLIELEEAKPSQDEETEPDEDRDPPPAAEEETGERKRRSWLRLRKRKKHDKETSTEVKDTKETKKKKKKKTGGKRRKAASQKMKVLGEKAKLLLLSTVRSIYRPIYGFFHGILHTEYRPTTDVYVLMFLADVVDFIVVVFGYWAFGKHSAAVDIASTLSDDQVPEAFLVMLLIQFSTMIIDRALYLRKTVLGKLFFQVVLVFGIHFWMFFILPAVTERMFSQNPVAQIWYFVKCIYFALSAYQIRCGYPTRVLGNFLTKKYNHLNLFLFQGFRMVPFLVELRAVMDWVWTDTTLSLSDWMCVEDIYANIFIIKCSRETEKKYPQPRGQKKKKIVKYGMGGLIIFFLICIIWFPLLFISLVRSVVGVVNHPVDVTVAVKLGGYEPLFTMSVQQQSIQPFTEEEYDSLASQFANNAVAMQFISLYSYEDIVTARIEGSSGSVWRISPPSRRKVIKELLSNRGDMTLRLHWNLQRDLGKGGTVEYALDTHSIELEPGSPVREGLAALLVGNRTKPVLIPHMFPNFIRAPNGAEAKPISQLYDGDEEGYENVTLSLKQDRALDGSGVQEWWDVSVADCDRSKEGCGDLPMVIFSDKVSPPSLGFLAGYGIMGLYVSVVLVIGKFVRGFFSEVSHSIMFEELPCVDRILKLCTDIFLVRETGELELEEELFSKLIFLYRSPETMIKWTRSKDSED
ncbi:piezo-type mechanosensitive ion channel component 1 isoform X2 [Anguilla anguilla]|uniref:piezo-type mechanosensitive ion channel component 1 isoform X2 n=1 Tax=Anguilla anguilla TaxID=7936 RepID=UPI0015AD7E67|nr:piezo-type mechanosensitive ion channel component 1 isoform X2 [Anguilla anguilla]